MNNQKKLKNKLVCTEDKASLSVPEGWMERGGRGQREIVPGEN